MRRVALHAVVAALTWLTVGPVPLSAGDDTLELTGLVKRARPCVVLIDTKDEKGEAVGQASGFFVSADGRLITNHHVLRGAASMTARTSDGTTLTVLGVLADDPANDLLLLKVSESWKAEFLTLADSGAVEVGQRIAIIGNPLGLEGSVSEGIVAGIRDDREVKGALQLTAPISAGSSGSPVLNRDGNVVGIVSWTLRGGQALNFAIPSAAANRLVKAAASAPQAILGRLKEKDDEEEARFNASSELKTAQSLRGKGSDWIVAAKALVKAFPQVAYGHAIYGEALASLRLFDESIIELKRAIELCPK